MVFSKDSGTAVGITFLLVCLLAFTGYSQCPDPVNQAYNNVSDNSATLTWDIQPTATEYRFACRIKNTSKWAEVATVSSNSFQANELLTGTTYQWGIRVICASGNSNFQFGPDFTTTGPAACGVPGNLAATQLSDSSVTLNWGAANGATSYKVLYWMQDALGDETDPSPNARVATTSTNVITLNGLQSGTTYLWTVRNVCGSIPMESNLAVFASFQTLGTVRCQDPANLSISYSVSGTPSFSCDVFSGATAYRFAYHQVGSPEEWVEIIQTDSSKFTPSLTDGLEYEWGMRTICENDNTVSSFLYGTNYIAGSRCQVPINLRSYERKVGMILRWNNRPEAQSYDLQIRVQGTTGWWNFNINNFIVVVTGTTPGATYEWRVRSICDATGGFVSDYSSIATFTPSSNPAQVNHIISYKESSKTLISRSLTSDAAAISIMNARDYPDLGAYSFGPNPARETVFIDALTSEKINQIGLYNSNGEKINLQMSSLSESNQLQTGQLSNGIYLLVITTEDGTFKERLVVL